MQAQQTRKARDAKHGHAKHASTHATSFHLNFIFCRKQRSSNTNKLVII